MSNRINIVTIIVVLLVMAGWYFYAVSLAYIIPVLLIYLVCNITGAKVIQLNYFFDSQCSIITSDKIVAISFDDGPHPDVTPELLKLLDKHNVLATFFCIGKNVDSNPLLVKDIISRGHIVGNHTYGHSNFFDLFSPSKMLKEIKDTNNAIHSATGVMPLFFRPPYGVTNPMLKIAIKKSGMISIGWSLRSFDTIHSGDRVISKLKNQTRPGDIVLFHDTGKEIISIMESYLIWLKENDYKVVSLAKLIEKSAYEI
jgi:peptidoglycan-N-acetylglucosamine deacetylase